MSPRPRQSSRRNQPRLEWTSTLTAWTHHERCADDECALPAQDPLGGRRKDHREGLCRKGAARQQKSKSSNERASRYSERRQQSTTEAERRGACAPPPADWWAEAALRPTVSLHARADHPRLKLLLLHQPLVVAVAAPRQARLRDRGVAHALPRLEVLFGARRELVESPCQRPVLLALSPDSLTCGVGRPIGELAGGRRSRSTEQGTRASASPAQPCGSGAERHTQSWLRCAQCGCPLAPPPRLELQPRHPAVDDRLLEPVALERAQQEALLHPPKRCHGQDRGPHARGGEAGAPAVGGAARAAQVAV